jgi:hypothetical protein
VASSDELTVHGQDICDHHPDGNDYDVSQLVLHGSDPGLHIVSGHILEPGNAR